MNQEVITLIAQIFEVCIIPLLGILTGFAVKFIKTKSAQIQARIDNELVDKYVGLASDVITACVVSTNQTYIESLKKEGRFDTEAQKLAFDKTVTSVERILSDEAKKVLTEAFGDLDAYIRNQIEATVNIHK